MPKNDVHQVVPYEHGWAVFKRGADVATSVHRTQKEAIEAARQISLEEKSDLMIYGKQGQLRVEVKRVREPRASNNWSFTVTNYLYQSEPTGSSIMELMPLIASNENDFLKVCKSMTQTRGAKSESLWDKFIRMAKKNRRDPARELVSILKERLETWEDQELDEEIGRAMGESNLTEEDAVDVVRKFRLERNQRRATS